MALGGGYCLLEGPPCLVASFGQLWKRCSLPLASLMTDFLEAVLREMACSVPVSLLCQSSSPYTSRLPPVNYPSFDCDHWHKGLRWSAAGNSTPGHPPSSRLKPTQGTVQAWQDSGCFGLEVSPGPPCSLVQRRRRLARPAPHAPSPCFCFLPSCFLSASCSNAPWKHFSDLRWESRGTWSRW